MLKILSLKFWYKKKPLHKKNLGTYLDTHIYIYIMHDRVVRSLELQSSSTTGFRDGQCLRTGPALTSANPVVQSGGNPARYATFTSPDAQAELIGKK